jgi:cyclophilin family peptidyl-prolyl cis-trans isomerase
MLILSPLKATGMKIRLSGLLLAAGLLILGCTKKTEQPPVSQASFTYITNGYIAILTSNSTNSPTLLTWDFGDGTPKDTGYSITHTYATSGTYSVQLTATNKGGSTTTKIDIIIKEKIIKISTTFGDMYMWLYNETPLHKANFLKLASSGFYTGTTFHRIIPNFVIQGGDSLSKDNDTTNDGYGGPSTLNPELNSTLTHIYGAVGSASLGAGLNSNNWQFYIVENTNGYHSLDGKYSVFGYIMKGREVAVTIAAQPKNTSNRPLTNIPMTVTVLDKTKAEIQSEYGYTVK